MSVNYVAVAVVAFLGWVRSEEKQLKVVKQLMERKSFKNSIINN